MKKIITLLQLGIISLLTPETSAQPALDTDPTSLNLECCTRCIQNLTSNPFKNVTTYNTPIISDSFLEYKTCGKVFNKYGSCCDQEDLYQYIRSFIEWTNQWYKKVLDISSSFKIHIKSADKIKDYLTAHKTTLIDNSGNTDQYLNSLIADEWIKMLEGYKIMKDEFLNNDLESAKSHLQKCFTRIATIRVNGLCLRCSSQAVNYFNPSNSTYKVDRSICFDLIDDCLPVYSYLVNITNFYNILVRMKKYKLDQYDLRLGTKGFRIIEFDKLKYLMGNLTIYQNRTGFDFTNGEIFGIMRNYCERFSLSQINQDLEASQVLWDVGVEIAQGLISNNEIPPGVADEGKGVAGVARRRVLENWDFSVNDGLGRIDPEYMGADLMGEFDSGTYVSIKSKEDTVAFIDIFNFVFVGFILLWI